MTVAIAWVRKLRACEELVFVSDSRLSGDGRTFDYSPKIITLPRHDCAISFAGYTGDAYPLMLQLGLAVEAHEPLLRRTIDLPQLRTHALRIFNSMADSIRSPLVRGQLMDVEFLFGGYSWVTKEFKLWSIVFDRVARKFRADPARTLRVNTITGRAALNYSTRTPDRVFPLGKIAFGGDQGPVARKRLVDLFTEKIRQAGPAARGLRLDWEPFQVVRDMLRDPNRADTIGGAPQVMKVYQYMQAGPIGVSWPSRADGATFLRGRPRLDYENLDAWVLDPDTLKSTHPKYGSSDDIEGEVPK